MEVTIAALLGVQCYYISNGQQGLAVGLMQAQEMHTHEAIGACCEEEGDSQRRGHGSISALSSCKLFVPPGPSVHLFTVDCSSGAQLTSLPRGLDNCAG